MGFTDEQVEQIDAVYDAVRNLFRVMTGYDPGVAEYGPIAEDIAETLKLYGYTVKFPWEDEDGNIHDIY